jgi:hypothetical protein
MLLYLSALVGDLHPEPPGQVIMPQDAEKFTSGSLSTVQPNEKS